MSSRVEAVRSFHLEKEAKRQFVRYNAFPLLPLFMAHALLVKPDMLVTPAVIRINPENIYMPPAFCIVRSDTLRVNIFRKSLPDFIVCHLTSICSKRFRSMPCQYDILGIINFPVSLIITKQPQKNLRLLNHLL